MKGLLNRIRSDTSDRTSESASEPSKLWQIGDHRVQKTTEKQKLYSTTVRTKHQRVEVYECIDCEKTNAHRCAFKHEECFEVITEEP